MSWLNGQPRPKEHTAKRLDRLKIDIVKLKYFGSLTTERKTFSKDDLHYFLDKSIIMKQLITN